MPLTVAAPSHPDALAHSGALRGDGPDFFCVGLQKAGTQWLYDQLQLHPDFWMPPFKELHYFDRAFPTGRILRATKVAIERPRRYARHRRKHGLRPSEPRDGRFFERVAAHLGQERSLEAYAELFAEKGDQLTGDITPGYSILDARTAATLAERFPDAKAVLLLRDPVERAWSAWRMRGKGRQPEEVQQDAKAFETYLDMRSTRARSFPSMIAPRWADAFGERFRFFFLDDIAVRPDAVRTEILRFLGADPAKGSGVEPDFNRKAKPAPYRSPEIQAILRTRFEAERLRCAELFGGPARDWPSAPY